MDMEWLYEAYRRTRKGGAVGVDGVTARQYETELESNLRSLLDRAKSGAYQAPPVRRVHIPKGKGTETRPIGIPTFEDKILQRAVAMLLTEVYEQDFLPCSFGFRPGRSPHDALAVLRQRQMEMEGGWVLDLDLRKFFDTLDHQHLRAFLRQRVCDGVLLRLIGKWLKAGVLEEGCVTHPKTGSPQGGVISPLLANIYLHDVLDTWFERMVKPRLKGRAFLIRFADDAVLVFEEEMDARRVLAVLPRRLEKYGLKLHAEKTRLVPFQIPRHRPEDYRPGTFDFLGFTHHWDRTRGGGWAIKRRIAKDRFNRALKSVTQWCRCNRHCAVQAQWRALSAKLRGIYEYYGISGTIRQLRKLQHQVMLVWRKWLSRRSDSAYIPWDKFKRTILASFPLPQGRTRRLNSPIQPSLFLKSRVREFRTLGSVGAWDG